MIQVSRPKETKKNTKAERIIFKNTKLKLPIVSETNLPYVDDASEAVHDVTGGVCDPQLPQSGQSYNSVLQQNPSVHGLSGTGTA